MGSTVSLLRHDWVTAPADLPAFDPAVRFRFSGPVNRPAVEARVRQQSDPVRVTFDWQSDREAVVHFRGTCNQRAVAGAAGALDARGNPLAAERNPAIQFHFPCHGTGYSTVPLDGQGPALRDWPGQWAFVLDVDAGGRILGLLGNLVYWHDPGTGTYHPLARANPLWAQFVPGDRVLMMTDSELITIDLMGRVTGEQALPGRGLAASLTAAAGEALVLAAAPGTDPGAELFRLTLDPLRLERLGTLAGPSGRFSRWADSIHLEAGPGPRQVRAQFADQPGWTADLASGATDPDPGPRGAVSPDGQWLAAPGRQGIFPVGHADGPAHLTLPAGISEWPLPVWSPDSRYVLFPGNLVADVREQRVLAEAARPDCDTLPQQIWAHDGRILLAFVYPCM